jgi:hypothetical protein
MGIRAENRTGILCVPFSDYILACDFAVGDRIKNNCNGSSKQGDRNYFPLFMKGNSIINVRLQ